MKDSAMIPTTVIVRYLEERYNILIKRDKVSRKLKYEMDKKYPANRDCQNMLHALVRMQEKNPRMLLRTQTAKGQALYSVCWGQVQWFYDYYRFGKVPGVSVDAKAVANSYDITFLSIGRRDNEGNLMPYFMGFLPNERSESIDWFLGKFKEFVCNQDGAIIRAIRSQFPCSKVVLDEWHLNTNQKKNCTEEVTKNKGKFTYKARSEALFDIHKAETEHEFYRLRDGFEKRFFSNRKPP